MGWLKELITERYHVMEGIKKYGGHFMKALAEAMARADADNLIRIKNTWYKEWKRFLNWGQGVFDESGRPSADTDKKIS